MTSASTPPSATGRLPCLLSLDLDDAWTYLRAAGRGDWQRTATVVPLVSERLLDLLRRHACKFTLFVIARDLEDERKLAAIRPFVQEGHEIGCHSYMHEPTFATLDKEQVRSEVLRACDLIEQKLGVRPVGFRAPGFAISPHTLAVLREAGVRYDGSFLPTFLGPLARLYYFFHSKLSAEEKRKRKAMYGGIGDAFGPLRARPFAGAPPVLNVPVSTMPLLRAPFHLSYVLWLSGFSRFLARRYLGLGLSLCRLTRLPPSYLMHSLDFVGKGEHGDLDFFPGMNLPWEHKREMLEHLMQRLTTSFRITPHRPFVDAALAAGAGAPA